MSRTDCHNSQNSPTLNRCKDPEKGRKDELKWDKKKEKKKKKVILFGEKLILFGLVWSLPQERVKGNSEDLNSQKNKIKKIEIKKGKNYRKGTEDW